jgi:hypothetical protein
MVPYYAAATVIVLGASILFASGLGRGRDLAVKSVPARGTPSPPRHEAASTFRPGGVTGNAPWALSAVPECFRQESEVRGAAAFVSGSLPPGARPLLAGTVVAVADCRLLVGASTLTLERGGERLVVPPDTRAYAAGGRLAVLRRAGGTADLRVYRRVSGDGP